MVLWGGRSAGAISIGSKAMIQADSLDLDFAYEVICLAPQCGVRLPLEPTPSAQDCVGSQSPEAGPAYFPPKKAVRGCGSHGT